MTEVLSEIKGPVARITLNRPQALNAINGALLNGLEKALSNIAAKAEVRVVILSGAGRAFCAGDDLKELETNQSYPGFYEGLVETLQEITRLIMFNEKMFISVVNGWAIGGGLSWVLNSDYVLFEDDARAFFPELKLGLYMSGAATAILPSLIGRPRAMRLFALGEQFSAQEALAMGVASEVVDAGQGLARAEEICETFLALSPDAIASLKGVQTKICGDAIEEALKSERESLLVEISKFKGAVTQQAAIR